MSTLPVILTPDLDDGGYVVECPAIPGCISQGDTREEALANIREAISLFLDNPDEPLLEWHTIVVR